MRSSWLLFPIGNVVSAFPSQQQAPLQPYDHSQGYRFDPLLHLPGVSPYFDAVGFGLEHKAPLDCKVTAAAYLVRHASIYANDKEYEKYIKPFLWKLEKHKDEFLGPLAFMRKWHSPIDEDRLEEITPAGHEDALNVGKHLLSRYPDLVPSTQKILADQKSRTYDTAKSFVKAFPQSDDIEIVRIKEDVNGSMDSLIPHKSCPAFNKYPGTEEMAAFVSVYANRVSKRLAEYTPWRLSDDDVVGFQQLCGYESAILGKRSEICKVFTDAEWMAYEYAWDLKYAYMVGPLNPLSNYLGFPWLKAQTTLFDRIDDNTTTALDSGWPDGQRFFLSFTHREVPPFVATALGIFNSTWNATKEFPTDRINWGRAWRMSDLIPFLGHVGLEKLSCGRPGSKGQFVRVIANTAPRPIYNCQSGPGASCPFDEFKYIIGAGAEKFSDFHGVCDKKRLNGVTKGHRDSVVKQPANGDGANDEVKNATLASKL